MLVNKDRVLQITFEKRIQVPKLSASIFDIAVKIIRKTKKPMRRRMADRWVPKFGTHFFFQLSTYRLPETSKGPMNKRIFHFVYISIDQSETAFILPGLPEQNFDSF